MRRAFPARVRGAHFLVAAVALAACFPDGATSGVGTGVGIRGETQLTATFEMSDPDVVFLLEVDDAPTDDAALVRAAVASTLRATVERFGDAGNWYDSQRLDPAAWHPVAIRVVLVFPSASDSSRTFGPSDDPRLALVASDSTVDQVDAVALAIGEDVASHLAAVGAPYRPIDAAMRTLELFAGARAAVDDHERALLDALGPAVRSVAMSVVSQRDDEGSDAVAAGAELVALESSMFQAGGAVFTADDDPTNGEQCNVPSDVTSRLGQWAAGAFVWLESLSLSCIVGRREPLLATGPTGTLSEDCPPEPLGPCVLTWSTPTLSACSAGAGLDDPLDPDGVRRPHTSMVDGAEQHICEVHALDGDDLAACETALACEGCSPGWCRTQLAIEPSTCPDHGYAFRFIGAAATRGAGQRTVTCDVAR